MNKVKIVEIEIHSYCNRKCEWCPNKFIDRTHKTFMEKETYVKILKDLKKNKYDGYISYSRYNEPFAIPVLFRECIRLAREIVPNVKLITNTNGDYLTKEMLELVKVDELTIMDYDNKGIEWCKERLEALGATNIYDEDDIAYGNIGKMKLAYFSNWSKNVKIEDRGGSLTKDNTNHNFKNDLHEREVSCFEPRNFIGIDYNGNVTPCCHIRSDNEAHKPYILGNVNDSSLSDIYNSEQACTFRDNVMNSKFYDPCKYCHKATSRYAREENPSIKYDKNYKR